jgi:uncharacterized membrane protein
VNSARENGSQPAELIHAPRPSWAPAFAAFAAALALCGIFAEGFMVRGWIYSIIGVIVLLAALRLIVRVAVRDYFRLPRKQTARGAVLPVKTISAPRS